MGACFFSCEKSGQEKYSIGFSQCTSISDWRKSMNYSMRIQASVYSNVDLELLDSEDSATKQIEDIVAWPHLPQRIEAVALGIHHD